MNQHSATFLSVEGKSVNFWASVKRKISWSSFNRPWNLGKDECGIFFVLVSSFDSRIKNLKVDVSSLIVSCVIFYWEMSSYSTNALGEFGKIISSEWDCSFMIPSGNRIYIGAEDEACTISGTLNRGFKFLLGKGACYNS